MEVAVVGGCIGKCLFWKQACEFLEFWRKIEDGFGEFFSSLDITDGYTDLFGRVPKKENKNKNTEM